MTLRQSNRVVVISLLACHRRLSSIPTGQSRNPFRHARGRGGKGRATRLLPTVSASAVRPHHCDATENNACPFRSHLLIPPQKPRALYASVINIGWHEKVVCARISVDRCLYWARAGAGRHLRRTERRRGKGRDARLLPHALWGGKI